MSCTDPVPTISPPWSPALGPTSTIKSAALIVSSSCSTTSIELPKSRISFNVWIKRSLSLWWRPIEGSSSTYNTPDNLLPICVAKRILCASPPDNVEAERANVK